MYEVNRAHSHSPTEQPGGLAAAYVLNRPDVPPVAWSSPVATIAALVVPGKYQNLGSGNRSRAITVSRLASSRCCSSACGTCTFARLTQSVDDPPKNRSLDRLGVCPSRFWPAHARLPWRVAITERARSKAKVATWPPLVPTLRRVTAGRPVFAVAVVYSPATEVAPARA